MRRLEPAFVAALRGAPPYRLPSAHLRALASMVREDPTLPIGEVEVPELALIAAAIGFSGAIVSAAAPTYRASRIVEKVRARKNRGRNGLDLEIDNPDAAQPPDPRNPAERRALAREARAEAARGDWKLS